MRALAGNVGERVLGVASADSARSEDPGIVDAVGEGLGIRFLVEGDDAGVAGRGDAICVGVPHENLLRGAGEYARFPIDRHVVAVDVAG